MARRLTGASFCTAGATVTGTGGGALARSAAPPPPEQAVRTPRPARKGASTTGGRSRLIALESICASAGCRHARRATCMRGIPVDKGAPGSHLSLARGAGESDAAGTQRPSVPPAAPSVDRQGRPRAVDRAALVLPERGGRAPHGARRGARAHAARAEPPPARAPRPPLPRVVPAHLAAQSDLRGGRGRLPLVAGCGGALVGAARQARAPPARDLRAARRPAEAAPPPARPAARVYGGRVHGELAPLPEGAPPGPESGPDPPPAPPLRPGGRALAPPIPGPWAPAP